MMITSTLAAHVDSVNPWMAEGPRDRGTGITTTRGTTWIPQVQPGKRNPTPHPRSPPLQPVYLRSRFQVGSSG